jgi:hypothetical protein
MGTFKTYFGYVIQKDDKHIHDFEIADLLLPKYSFYVDNTSLQVVRWVEEKQKNGRK